MDTRIPDAVRQARVPFQGFREFQRAFGARLFPDPEALERARAAEGEDHRAELGDCGFCGCMFHPDCAMCAGAAA